MRIPVPSIGGGTAPAPLPGPFASPDASPQAFGAGQATAVGEAADVATTIYSHEREKVITAQALKAEADIETGANDSVIKFRQLKSGDAGRQSQAYLDQIKKDREDYLGKIEDPSVRRIAEMRTYSTMKQANHQVGAWVAQQNDVAAEDGFNSKSASALTSVSLAGRDAVLRQKALDSMKGPLTAEADRQGLQGSPDDPATPRGDFFAKWNATAAKTSVESMLGQNLVEDAQAYMALPGVRESLARLGPDQLQAIENRIRTHADLQGAITDGLGLVQKYRTPGTTLINERAALDEAEKLKVGPERKLKTIELIESQATRGKTAQAQTNATVFEQGRAIYEKFGSLTPEDPGAAATLARVQAHLLNPANQATGLWESLRDRARLDARRDANDPPTEAERKAAVAIRTDMADHPEKYLGWTPEKFSSEVWDKVAPRDFAALGGTYDALHKRTEQMAGAVAKGLPDRIDSMLVKLGRDQGVFPSGKLPPTAWTRDQSDLYYAAREAVAQQAAQITRATGKPPPQAEYEKLVNDELIKGHVIGGGRIFGDSFEVTRLQAEQDPRYRGKAFVPSGAAKPVEPVPHAVRVIAPDGRHGTIPSSQVDDALKNGYRRE